MPSAAITVSENPATIESDATEAVITKNSTLRTLQGELRNHGPADTWLMVSTTEGTAAVTVVTTGAQAQSQVPLPAGATLAWLNIYWSIAHKTAGGLATLSWVPDKALDVRRG